MGSSGSEAPPKDPLRRRLFARPSTGLGRWSVALGATFVVMSIINSTVFMPSESDAPWRHVFLPYYGIGMLLCGLAAGIVGLIAIVRRGERSWLVWLCVLPGLFVTCFVLGEFLSPH